MLCICNFDYKSNSKNKKKVYTKNELSFIDGSEPYVQLRFVVTFTSVPN